MIKKYTFYLFEQQFPLIPHIAPKIAMKSIERSFYGINRLKSSKNDSKGMLIRPITAILKAIKHKKPLAMTIASSSQVPLD
jgi:hypothetical protein